MDFLTSNNRYKLFAKITKQGSNTELHLMKGKLG